MRSCGVEHDSILGAETFSLARSATKVPPDGARTQTPFQIDCPDSIALYHDAERITFSSAEFNSVELP